MVLFLVMEHLTEYLQKLRQWYFINKIKYINFYLNSFNFPCKIKFHHLDYKNENHQYPCRKEKVFHFKYLGINLDKKFKCDKHITSLQNVIKSTKRKFYFLRNMSNPAKMCFVFCTFSFQITICCSVLGRY